MKQGVPQGGVLSPTLFNLYMSKMPTPPDGIVLITYADDSTVLNSGPKIDTICKELNEYLDGLDTWFKSRNLFISPGKSSATIFTTWSNEKNAQLPISINGSAVPTTQNPKILGVTFDPMLTFEEHTTIIKDRVNKRNNILKALAGTTWGKDKETLLTTYQAIGRSVVNYCAPIFTPMLSNTNWKKLQTCQNMALKVATGCHKISSETHVHAECKMLPIKEHNEMLTKQFILRTQRPDQPGKVDLDSGDGPQYRHMKDTMKKKYGDYVHKILRDTDPKIDINSELDNVTYKHKLRDIHKDCVKSYLANRPVNQVLNAQPEPVHADEAILTRQARTTLAQLRSGERHSMFLKSYEGRINNDVNILCPKCSLEPHTTSHLFTCSRNPPNSPTVESMWLRPVQAAQFLELIQEEPG